MSRRRLNDSPSDAVVDGQVIGKTDQPVITQLGPVPGGPDITQPPIQGQMMTVAPDDLETKARAFAMFVRIPFFLWLTLDGKMPPLVRLGAAALAVWDVRQIYLQQGEISAALPDLPDMPLLPSGY